MSIGTKARLFIVFLALVIISYKLSAPERLLFNNRIISAADWLERSQNVDGFFKYEYDLSSDRYSKSNNIVRQAAAAYALAQTYNYLHEKKYSEASKKTIDRIIALSELKEVGGHANRFIPHEGKVQSNANAILILAILELTKSDKTLLDAYSEILQELANHILASRTYEGLFNNIYDKEVGLFRISSDDYNNGESLLALAELYGAIPKRTYLEAAVKTADAIARYYREEWNKACYAWCVRGMISAYRLDPKTAYRKFIFSNTDLMLETDYFSGDRATIALGIFLEGLAPVYRLAKAEQNWNRAAVYKKAIEFGLSKMLKLQILEQGILSSNVFENAKGGFCFDTACKKIRIDNAQHGIAAMIAISNAGL